MPRLLREIVYHYGDASVPPDCHRSYTITVTAETAWVVVDSYGDVLAEKEYPVAAGQFDALANAFERCGIRRTELGFDDEGATGGTTETLSWSDGDGECFKATVYHCGGRDAGDLGGDVETFAAAVRALIPDLDKLTR